MDTMDFVKRAWATLDLSSPFAPTLSVDEIDKRIADLRAVEQWLALNQGMLRNTIQGLEIQRGTLAAVQNLTDSFGRMTRPPGEDTAEALARFAAATVRPPQAPPVANPFVAAASRSAAPEAAAAPQPARASPSAATEPAEDERTTPHLAWGSSMDPLGWWKVLQGNFEQIARMAGGQPDTDAAQPPSKAKAARQTGTKPAPRRKARRASSGEPAKAGASAEAKSGERR